MLSFLKTETVAIMGLTEASIALAVGFGTPITAQQESLLVAFMAALLTVVTRSTVTPNSKVSA